MRKLTIFESAIIGFFVGVIAAAFVVFFSSVNGFVANTLSLVSLLPVLELINIPSDKIIPATFLFVVFVFTFYGFVVGIIIKKSTKIPYVIIGLMLLVAIVTFFEQKNGVEMQAALQDSELPVSAAVVKVLPKLTKPEQYFGQEARGDLNLDGEDDVAFIVSRPDGKRIALYYLIASLKTEVGYAGTNIIFLGDKIRPEKINIASSTIIVDYTNLSGLKDASTSTKKFYAKVVDGQLKETQND